MEQYYVSTLFKTKFRAELRILWFKAVFSGKCSPDSKLLACKSVLGSIGKFGITISKCMQRLVEYLIYIMQSELRHMIWCKPLHFLY